MKSILEKKFKKGVLKWLLICLYSILITSNRNAVFADNMNLFIDQNIAIKYPSDFLFNQDKKIGEYDFTKGKASFAIKILNKNKWQSFQSTYFYSQGYKESFPPKYPVSLGGDLLLDEYNENRFQGIIIKSNLKRGLDSSPQKILLFLSRENHYLFITIWSNKDMSLDLVSSMLQSVAFPGESRYLELSKVKSKSVQMETFNSLKLNYLQKFGNKRPNQTDMFNISYATDEILEAQRKAVRSLVENEKEVFEKSKEAIFLYYTEFVYPFYVREGLSDDLGLRPAVSKDEMLDMVTFSSLDVLQQTSDGAVPIGLHFFCNWSDEGLGLRLINNKIVAVGNDYVALGVEDGWEGLKH